MANIDLRQSLKSATSSLHRELDKSPVMLRLMCADADPQDIARALKALQAAHIDFNTLASRIQPVDELLGLMCREVAEVSTALAGDLAALGDCSGDLEACNLCLPVCCDSGMAGALYCVLGSSMGAEMIAKRLQASPHAQVRKLTYFPRSAASVPRFFQLMGYLELRKGHSLSVDQLILGAQHAFKLFIHYAHLAGVVSNTSAPSPLPS